MNSILESRAYWDLKNHWAPKMMLVFLDKRQRGTPMEFTYHEGHGQFGIPSYAFTRAIDQLIEHGLIDIASTGMGLRKNKTLYEISGRWQKYGTPSFVRVTRKKREGWHI